MSTSDRCGPRVRFLAAIEDASARGDEPAWLCAACVHALPVSRAGIAIQAAGSGLEVLCASDAVAQRVEWLQVTLGQGPGVEAVASGRPVMASDLTAPDGRWPAFAPAATESGVGAMYALPLQVGAIRVGVLDLYRDAAAGLDRSDFADAVTVAQLVTAILLTVERTGLITESLGPWWDQPMATREVHQATGMVMAQLGVNTREAYVRLQAFAYLRGRLLDQIAHDVIHRRLRFDPDADPDPDPLAATR